MVGGQTPEQRWEGRAPPVTTLLLAGRSMVTQKEIASPPPALRSTVRWGETPSWGLYPHRGQEGDQLLGVLTPGCVTGQMSDMGPAACRHLLVLQLICPLRAGAPGSLHVLKPLPPPPKPTENSSSFRRPPAGPGHSAGSVWTPRNMPTTPAVTPLLPEAVSVCVPRCHIQEYGLHFTACQRKMHTHFPS